MLVGRCGQCDPVLLLHVVVGEDSDAQQPIHVGHRRLQFRADQPPHAIRAVRVAKRAVVVEAGDSGVAEGEDTSLPGGCGPGVLQHAVAWEVGARR